MNSLHQTFHLNRIGPPATKSGVANVMDFEKVTSLIGRNKGQVDFVLDSTNQIASQYISRLHARVVRQENNSHRLFDDSLNGIFINNSKMMGSVVLQEGDIVTFGHPCGVRLKPGVWARQPDSEYRFIFEKCSCGSPGNQASEKPAVLEDRVNTHPSVFKKPQTGPLKVSTAHKEAASDKLLSKPHHDETVNSKPCVLTSDQSDKSSSKPSHKPPNPFTTSANQSKEPSNMSADSTLAEQSEKLVVPCSKQKDQSNASIDRFDSAALTEARNIINKCMTTIAGMSATLFGSGANSSRTSQSDLTSKTDLCTTSSYQKTEIEVEENDEPPGFEEDDLPLHQEECSLDETKVINNSLDLDKMLSDSCSEKKCLSLSFEESKSPVFKSTRSCSISNTPANETLPVEEQNLTVQSTSSVVEDTASSVVDTASSSASGVQLTSSPPPVTKLSTPFSSTSTIISVQSSSKLSSEENCLPVSLSTKFVSSCALQSTCVTSSPIVTNISSLPLAQDVMCSSVVTSKLNAQLSSPKIECKNASDESNLEEIPDSIHSISDDSNQGFFSLETPNNVENVCSDNEEQENRSLSSTSENQTVPSCEKTDVSVTVFQESETNLRNSRKQDDELITCKETVDIDNVSTIVKEIGDSDTSINIPTCSMEVFDIDTITTSTSSIVKEIVNIDTVNTPTSSIVKEIVDIDTVNTPTSSIIKEIVDIDTVNTPTSSIVKEIVDIDTVNTPTSSIIKEIVDIDTVNTPTSSFVENKVKTTTGANNLPLLSHTSNLKNNAKNKSKKKAPLPTQIPVFEARMTRGHKRKLKRGCPCCGDTDLQKDKKSANHSVNESPKTNKRQSGKRKNNKTAQDGKDVGGLRADGNDPDVVYLLSESNGVICISDDEEAPGKNNNRSTNHENRRNRIVNSVIGNEPIAIDDNLPSTSTATTACITVSNTIEVPFVEQNLVSEDFLISLEMGNEVNVSETVKETQASLFPQIASFLKHKSSNIQKELISNSNAIHVKSDVLHPVNEKGMTSNESDTVTRTTPTMNDGTDYNTINPTKMQQEESLSNQNESEQTEEKVVDPEMSRLKREVSDKSIIEAVTKEVVSQQSCDSIKVEEGNITVKTDDDDDLLQRYYKVESDVSPKLECGDCHHEDNDFTPKEGDDFTTKVEVEGGDSSQKDYGMPEIHDDASSAHNVKHQDGDEDGASEVDCGTPQVNINDPMAIVKDEDPSREEKNETVPEVMPEIKNDLSSQTYEDLTHQVYDIEITPQMHGHVSVKTNDIDSMPHVHHSEDVKGEDPDDDFLPYFHDDDILPVDDDSDDIAAHDEQGSISSQIDDDVISQKLVGVEDGVGDVVVAQTNSHFMAQRDDDLTSQTDDDTTKSEVTVQVHDDVRSQNDDNAAAKTIDEVATHVDDVTVKTSDSVKAQANDNHVTSQIDVDITYQLDHDITTETCEDVTTQKDVTDKTEHGVTSQINDVLVQISNDDTPQRDDMTVNIREDVMAHDNNATPSVDDDVTSKTSDDVTAQLNNDTSCQIGDDVTTQMVDVTVTDQRDNDAIPAIYSDVSNHTNGITIEMGDNDTIITNCNLQGTNGDSTEVKTDTTSYAPDDDMAQTSNDDVTAALKIDDNSHNKENKRYEEENGNPTPHVNTGQEDILSPNVQQTNQENASMSHGDDECTSKDNDISCSKQTEDFQDLGKEILENVKVTKSVASSEECSISCIESNADASFCTSTPMDCTTTDKCNMLRHHLLSPVVEDNLTLSSECKDSDDECKDSDGECKDSDGECKDSDSECKDSDSECKDSDSECKDSELITNEEDTSITENSSTSDETSFHQSNKIDSKSIAPNSVMSDPEDKMETSALQKEESHISYFNTGSDLTGLSEKEEKLLDISEFSEEEENNIDEEEEDVECIEKEDESKLSSETFERDGKPEIDDVQNSNIAIQKLEMSEVSNDCELEEKEKLELNDFLSNEEEGCQESQEHVLLSSESQEFGLQYEHCQQLSEVPDVESQQEQDEFDDLEPQHTVKTNEDVFKNCVFEVSELDNVLQGVQENRPGVVSSQSCDLEMDKEGDGMESEGVDDTEQEKEGSELKNVHFEKESNYREIQSPSYTLVDSESQEFGLEYVGGEQFSDPPDTNVESQQEHSETTEVAVETNVEVSESLDLNQKKQGNKCTIISQSNDLELEKDKHDDGRDSEPEVDDGMDSESEVDDEPEKSEGNGVSQFNVLHSEEEEEIPSQSDVELETQEHELLASESQEFGLEYEDGPQCSKPPEMESQQEENGAKTNEVSFENGVFELSESLDVMRKSQENVPRISISLSGDLGLEKNEDDMESELDDGEEDKESCYTSEMSESNNLNLDVEKKEERSELRELQSERKSDCQETQDPFNVGLDTQEHNVLLYSESQEFGLESAEFSEPPNVELQQEPNEVDGLETQRIKTSDSVLENNEVSESVDVIQESRAPISPQSGVEMENKDEMHVLDLDAREPEKEYYTTLEISESNGMNGNDVESEPQECGEEQTERTDSNELGFEKSEGECKGQNFRSGRDIELGLSNGREVCKYQPEVLEINDVGSKEEENGTEQEDQTQPSGLESQDVDVKREGIEQKEEMKSNELALDGINEVPSANNHAIEVSEGCEVDNDKRLEESLSFTHEEKTSRMIEMQDEYLDENTDLVKVKEKVEHSVGDHDKELNSDGESCKDFHPIDQSSPSLSSYKSLEEFNPSPIKSLFKLPMSVSPISAEKPQNDDNESKAQTKESLQHSENLGSQEANQSSDGVKLLSSSQISDFKDDEELHLLWSQSLSDTRSSGSISLESSEDERHHDFASKNNKINAESGDSDNDEKVEKPHHSQSGIEMPCFEKEEVEKYNDSEKEKCKITDNDDIENKQNNQENEMMEPSKVKELPEDFEKENCNENTEQRTTYSFVKDDKSLKENHESCSLDSQTNSIAESSVSRMRENDMTVTDTTESHSLKDSCDVKTLKRNVDVESECPAEKKIKMDSDELVDEESPLFPLVAVALLSDEEGDSDFDLFPALHQSVDRKRKLSLEHDDFVEPSHLSKRDKLSHSDLDKDDLPSGKTENISWIPISQPSTHSSNSFTVISSKPSQLISLSVEKDLSPVLSNTHKENLQSSNIIINDIGQPLSPLIENQSSFISDQECSVLKEGVNLNAIEEDETMNNRNSDVESESSSPYSSGFQTPALSNSPKLLSAQSVDKENASYSNEGRRQAHREKLHMAVLEELQHMNKEIRTCLSKDKPNVDQAVNVLQDLQDTPITSSILSKFPSILETLNKCRKYKQNEDVRQLSQLIYTRFKALL